MLSTKPYLVRAIHEWCVDQGFTPYLAVSVDAGTRVPREFVKDGEIVLNVGFDATNQMSLGNEVITFQARFGGRSFSVLVPIERVMAIYARENGQGMAFEVTEAGEDDGAGNSGNGEVVPIKPGDGPGSRPPGGRSHLTRIK